MPDQSTTPALVLVSGLPASGKSSLARQIGEAIALPVFSKDDFKELFFNTLGWSTREWSKQLGGVSTELLWIIAERVLGSGTGVVLESNFVREFADPRLANLRKRQGVTVIEVHCTADREVLAQRYRERADSGERHPGHMESNQEIVETELVPRIREAADDPLTSSDTVIEVDTTDFDRVDLDAVVGQIRSAMP